MPDTEDLCYRGIHALAVDIRRREVSPVDLARAFLERIEALNPRFAAYLTVTAEIALADARRAEAEVSAGKWRGPLHGIPFGVKDIFETAGVRTTHGSSFFPDFIPTHDAEAVRRLREAGAIMLGKTLTHEFAAATTTINPHYGTARNPWNRERITGGSSGGSAAAVAAGLCTFALGSDTGGSIRNPAALCGVVGLKPTHGRVSLDGVCPNVLTFDHVGPLTSSARDAALVLQALAGYDRRDAMSRDRAVPDYTAGWEQAVSGRRFVVCPDFYMNAEVDAEVRGAFDAAVDVFRSLGAHVEEVSFPNGKRLTELFPAIAGPEFAEFHRPFFEMNPDGYGASVRERLDWSFRITSDEYVRALRERELLQREVAEFFERADALLLPAMPCTAAPIESLLANVNGKTQPCTWIHRPFQSPHNFTGCPAIAVPMGFDRDGLPLSLQIVTARWHEARLLAIADAYEEATPELRARRPPC